MDYGLLSDLDESFCINGHLIKNSMEYKKHRKMFTLHTFLYFI